MAPNTTSLPGARWRNTHQSSVDAVLGAGIRSVASRGSAFVNRDNWTARKFIDCLCQWAAANPGQTPARYDVEAWVHEANQNALGYGETPGIIIAETPDDLPIATAMSLVGGAYHEAWHTKYSRRTPLTTAEILPNLMDLWSAVPNWGPLTGALLNWSNIVEDIRIERLGNAAYPGAKPRLEALQDLILRMEAEGYEEAVKRGIPTNDDLNVVTCAFRDLGLGYTTIAQRTALKVYRQRSPDAYALVDSGDLRPMLDAAINLTDKDDLGCLWLAMAIVAHIVKSAEKEQEQPKPPPKPGKGQPQPKPPKQEEPDESDEDEDEGSGDGESDDDQDDDQDDDGQGSDDQDEDDKQDDEDKSGKGKSKDKDRQTYKVGDRARLTTGPHKGREVEVTSASEPDENGVQILEFALVEAD